MSRRWITITAAVVVAAVLTAGLGLWAGGRVREGRIKTRLAALTPLIDENAWRTGVSPDLIRAVIRVESSGDPQAVSSAGARGLMQITPAAETDAIKVLNLPENLKGDLFDPKYNLLIGVTYLAHLRERFDGDDRLALAAYHMGPTAVARLQREHPDLSSQQLIDQFAGPQTRAYVRKVMQAW